MESAPGEEEVRRLEKRLGELNGVLASGGLESLDQVGREAILAELSGLGRELSRARKYQQATRELREAEALAKSDGDRGVRELALEEARRLRAEIARLDDAAREAPAGDSLDGRNAIVEIRAGTGGEEAALFARDLFRMYSRFAERKGFSIEVFDSQFSAQNGVRSLTFLARGKGAYGVFRNESGVHRVQRVPATESSGRVHTSAATVAAFPEIPDREVSIRDQDLRIDTFCAGGHGGQSVNTTYSAVRLTHLPTGLVVSCQDERSQLQNRRRALKVLAARLAERERESQAESLSEARRNRIGAGDRSEKIRTYNFPQNRVTDHRVNYTGHNLREVMDGELDRLISSLAGSGHPE